MAVLLAEHPAAAGRKRGFVLLEVVVATVILSVGLVAAAGMVQLAARELALASRAEAARWAVTALADSVMAGAAPGEGERQEPWGTLRWMPSAQGVLIEALRPEAPDRAPLARLWIAVVEKEPA